MHRLFSRKKAEITTDYPVKSVNLTAEGYLCLEIDSNFPSAKTEVVGTLNSCHRIYLKTAVEEGIVKPGHNYKYPSIYQIFSEQSNPNEIQISGDLNTVFNALKNNGLCDSANLRRIETFIKTVESRASGESDSPPSSTDSLTSLGN